LLLFIFNLSPLLVCIKKFSHRILCFCLGGIAVALHWHRRLIVVVCFLFVSLPVSAHQKCKKTYYFCSGGISSSFAGIYVFLTRSGLIVISFFFSHTLLAMMLGQQVWF